MKIAVIDFDNKGGYVATFPDKEPKTDTSLAVLVSKCIAAGYSVECKILGE